jgi:hypothetical protein
MPVTRRLMKPGTWSLKLRENTPKSVYSRVGRGDLLVLLPNRLQPVDGFTDASLLAAATYTGTITALPSSTDLRGHGLEWWLGTPKGYGPGTAGTQGLLTTPVAFTAGTLSQWVTALCPPGLTVGTVTNGALPTLTNSYQFVTRREALDDVCRKIGAEFRVNPTGTIDAAAPATLFGANAQVVVTRKEEGRDGPYQGLQGSVISTSRDIEEFISKAVVVTSGTGTATTATTTTGSTLFRDPQGNLCHVERYIDAPSELAANAGLIGTAAINRFNVERRDLRLSSKTWNVSRFAEPGDYVYAYDAADGLVDAANQIIYRGEVITPLALRVFGLSWPIESGMGVYVRTATGVGTFTWTDLSDHMVWETGDVSWEVGAARRPLVGTSTGPTSEGTVAYLGVNPTVSARAAAPGYVDRGGGFTPQTGITAATDLTDCSVTFTAPPGRLYRIYGQCRVLQNAATSVPELEVAENGTTIDKWSETLNAGQTAMATVTALAAPAAGAVTYKLRLLTGAGNVDTVIGATQPSRIIVEDIGPA